MRLSIVIVCFGGEVDRLLVELDRQRQPGDELIVVDNLASAGGTDGVRGHPAVDRLIEPERNLGFSAAINRAAELATGDVLLLLNPDAVPAAGCLAALRSPPSDWAAWMAIVTLEDAVTVNTAGGVAHFTGVSWIGGLGDAVSTVPAAPYAAGFLSGACLAIRLEAWKHVGGMPGHFFLYLEDVDLSHRLRLAGLTFGVLPDARVAHSYAFDKGALKWRQLERNRWAMVLRTYPGPVLAAALPAMLIAEPALLAVAVSQGWGGAKLRSWIDVLRWLPRARGERRAVQALRVTSASSFAAALVTDLDTPLLGGVGRSRLLRAGLRGYWRIARMLISRASS